MKTIRRFGVLCVSLVTLVVASLLGTYRASQSVPAFYELALIQDTEAAGQAGDELERQVMAMASDVEQGEHWELALTDQQINGWLATDLAEKFPRLLPREVQAPRVSFQDQLTCVACRLDSGKVSTILSLKLEAYLTDEPNEIAVRVQRVRAGLLPVPLTKILDQISEAARQSGVSLRWSQRQGDPVALVTLPVEHPDLRPGVLLQRLEVGPGELIISGTAKASLADHPANGPAQPRLAESIDDAWKDQR